MYCIHIKKLSKTEGIQEKRGGGGAGGVFISLNNNKNHSTQLKYINITYKIFVIIVNNAQTCYSMLFIYLHCHSFVPPSTWGYSFSLTVFPWYFIIFPSLYFLVLPDIPSILYFFSCIPRYKLVFPGIPWYSQVFFDTPLYSLIVLGYH